MKTAAVKERKSASRARPAKASERLATSTRAQWLAAPAPPAKLTLGRAHDAYERQADAVARAVVHGQVPAEGARPGARAGELQRLPGAGATRVAAVPARVAATIRNPGAGHPLPSAVRAPIEGHLGVGLEHVRVHAGPAAAAAASDLRAHAFTHGAHVFLGRDRSSSDLGLMAHEAAHVVQQGAAGPDAAVQRASLDAPTVQGDWTDAVSDFASSAWDATGGRVVDAVGEAVGEVVEMGAAVVWQLLDRYAPSLVPILRAILDRGIVGYLKGLVGDAIRGAMGALGVDPAVVESAFEIVNGLLGAAREILAALAAGDCRPLFAAIGRLSAAAEQMAGRAWDVITEFLQPVGDFFTDLWQRFGAPAVDWIREAASDAWSSITQLGQRLWDWTQPVRDQAAAAWTWIKNQLGVGEGSEGREGLLQWVQGKLGDAWQVLRGELEPVVAPIRAVASRVRAILPLDAILNLRDTVRAWLADVGKMVGRLQQPQDAVENQDALRGEILPAVLASIESLRASLVGAGAWVAGRIGGLVDSVREMMAGLRANPVVGALAGALDWLDGAATRLGQWASEQVIALFGAIGNGLVRLARFIRPLLDTLEKLLAVVGDVVAELPGLVLGPFWRLIPACIREPITQFVIEHILRNIPIINRFLDVPAIWGRIRNLVLGFLRRVFVNGDLGGAVMTVIRFVLEAAGVDVNLLLRIVGNAADALERILMDPVGFLGNLFAALSRGFGQFVSRILVHLGTGLLGWLLGPLADLGVTPPRDLSLRSVLDLVLQILGVSAARLQQKVARAAPGAARVIGEAWRWISALIDGGIGGLWEEIKGRLADLWSTVIGGITGWITTNVVEAGIAFLLKMSNPVGAVLQAIQAAYKTLSFFVEKINKILAVVDAIVGSVAQIAAGAISGAADWIENAMARTVPLVIGFLADLMNVSDPAPRIRQIVERIRGKVDQALDWLVEKAVTLGRRLLSGLGIGRGAGDHGQKWEAGVRGVTADVERLKADGLTNAEITAKFPEWKRTYGFTELELRVEGDEFEVLGAMSAKRRVTKAASGLHSGTSNDPIPIYWYKPPGAYRPLSLTIDGERRSVSMSDRVTVNDRHAGTQQIGVFGRNVVDTGTRLERTSGTDDLRSGGQNRFSGVLRRLGYDLSARGEDADHVTDLGFGGTDEFSNLWPLDRETNQRGLRYYGGYRVEYLEGGQVKRSNLTRMAGKYFTIKGFRYSDPMPLGGRD